MSNHRRATSQQRDRSEQNEEARIEILCIACGFGAVVSIPPRRCPMCGGSDWGRCRASRVDGRLTPSMARSSSNGSREPGKRDENDVPRDERAQRTPSPTNVASLSGPRRKEHVMEPLDCERTAGR